MEQTVLAGFFFHKTCLILAPFISMSSLVCCKITIFLNDLFVLFFLFVYFIYFSRLFPFPIYSEVPYYVILDISIMHSDMVVPCPLGALVCEEHCACVMWPAHPGSYVNLLGIT